MVTGALVLAGMLVAQGPGPSDVVPLKERSFSIPIRVDPARRHEIKELQLFTSADLGKSWQQYSVATPEKDAFTYHAPGDGVYWFSVCVVDMRGNRDPKDINAAPPGQKVLIDTLKPTVRITGAERQGDEVVVAWEVQEDHPELSTFKLEYQSADAPSWMWTAAAANPVLMGQTRFRPAGTGPAKVRLTLADTAGNVGTMQLDVKGTLATNNVTTVAAQGLANQPIPVMPTPGPSAAPSATTQQGMAPTMPVLPTPGGEAPRTASAPVLPPVTPPAAAPSSPTEPAWEKSPPIQPASLTPQNDARAWQGANPGNPQISDSGSRLIASTNNSRTPTLAPTSMTNGRTARIVPGLQLTNSTRISLDYEARVGPSGLAKVELFVTSDEGRTWIRLADDPDLKSPITADLPGDGIYGLSLVVTSGAGRGKKPPQSGDLPQMKIEVDTKLPDATLFQPTAAPGRRDALLLTWEATDKNITATPISLYWAEKPGEQWQPIALDLPNTGSHVWQLPAKMPIEVFLRLVVRDTAGNQSVAETARPELIDLVEPEVQIKGLLGSTRQPN